MAADTRTIRRERAWLELAEHFVDTETRHWLPRTALACVEAGFDVEEMRAALLGRIAPELGSNLLSVAGEWAGWAEAPLLAALRLRDGPVSPWSRAASRCLPGVEGTSRALARFMRLIEPRPPAEREALVVSLSYLGRVYFDFDVEDPSAPAPVDTRDAALIDAFFDAIRPVTTRACRVEGEQRVARWRAQRDNRAASGIDVRPLLASPGAWQEALGLPFALPSTIATKLIASYAEGTRAYHDLSHVVELFGHFGACETWHEPAPVALAILLHDAVYDARATDNEEKSAQLLEAMVRDTELAPDAARAAALVRLTATHGAALPGALDDDAARFLDCDLAILGADAARYEAYEAAIAVEYAHLPRPVYRFGRARFLGKLLERERIFLTEPFHRRYDAPARANLERAVDSLRPW